MKTNTVYLFEKIYKDEGDVIFRFCLVRVSNREQALDILQETFLRLWQNMSEDKEILNSRAFLFTVAHHLIIDWYRKKKSLSLDKLMNTYQEAEYILPDTAIENNPELGAEGRYLLGKLKDLAPPHQQPVYLRFVEGLSPREIGDILGITENAASVRINRGLSELRRKTGYDNKENNKN